MVDRTVELWELAVAGSVDGVSPSPPSSSSSTASPFIINAATILSRIEEMQKVADDSFIPYIGYHSHIKACRPTILHEKDRRSLDQDMAIFIATCASSVHDLGEHLEPRSTDHHKVVIGFLIDVSNNHVYIGEPTHCCKRYNIFSICNYRNLIP